MADLVRTHHQGDKDPHEGADTPVCVSLHAKHATIEGYKALIIEAADVVAIVCVMTFLQELGLEGMWIKVGQGRTLRWI